MRTLFGLSLILIVVSCGRKTSDGGIDFTVDDLEGNRQTFSQFRGKTVLLNVWATWCAPCMKEIPDLKSVYDERRDEGVVVLGVLLDSKSPEAAKPTVDKLGINYPVWYGDADFARQFNIAVFPTTVLIDSSGRVVKRFDYAMSKKQFDEALEEAL